MEALPSSSFDPCFLLKAFTVPEPWVERGCGYRQWRTLRGEVGPVVTTASDSDVLPPLDSFESAQQVSSQSYEVEGILGEGNYSQVFKAKMNVPASL